MHPELKRLASNVSQWPAGYKWVRSDSSVQMMTMSRNDYAPDNDHHWFSYQEWYQARRTLDFPLPSGRIDVAPAPPLPDESAASGPLGRYQWGVEYTVKGVKPEIADDVRVSYICEGGLTGECELRKLGWNAVCITVETIKIIDPRYKPTAPDKKAIEVGKRYIDGNYLIYVIAEHHFKPGFYFASESIEGAKVQVVSGEYLEPVTEELMTLIELTGSVGVARKIIEAGYKRG